MEFLRKNRMTITVAGVVLLILVRMLVLLLGIDPINGYSKSVLWSILQFAVCAVLVLLLSVPILIRKQAPLPAGDSRLFRIMTAIAAGVYFIQVITSLVQLWTQFSSAIMMYQLQIPWVAIAKVVLSILAVGFFFLLCRCGTRLPSEVSLSLILGPIGLYIFRLIDGFMSITTNPSVDTYSLLVLSGGLTLFFLSQLGRMLLDGVIGRGFWIASSLASLVLSLSSVAALMFAVMQAPVYAGLIGWSDLLCDVAMLLVAVSAVSLAKPVPVHPRRHAMVGSAVPKLRRQGRYIPKH